MRAFGIAVASFVVLAGCKGGGGFGHALGGLGHGLGHVGSGLGHVGSGLGHVGSGIGHAAGHGGGSLASGLGKGARHVGHGAHGAGSVAGRAIRGGADVPDVIDDALELAADTAIDDGSAIIVVDGVDPDDPCMLAAAGGASCDDGYACVPRAGLAVCVPLSPPGATPPGATPPSAP